MHYLTLALGTPPFGSDATKVTRVTKPLHQQHSINNLCNTIKQTVQYLRNVLCCIVLVSHLFTYRANPATLSASLPPVSVYYMCDTISKQEECKNERLHVATYFNNSISLHTYTQIKVPILV